MKDTRMKHTIEYTIEIEDHKYFGRMINILGPGLEFRKDDQGRGINCTGLSMTNNDEYVLSECETIASCIQNIMETRGIKAGE